MDSRRNSVKVAQPWIEHDALQWISLEFVPQSGGRSYFRAPDTIIGSVQ